MRADDLLEGPRGRRTCLELALAWGDVAGGTDELACAVFAMAQQLDVGAGSSRVVFTIAAGGGSFERANPEPTPTPGDVVSAWAALPIGSVDAAVLHAAVVTSVDRARYWQEPDGEDVLLAVPLVRPQIARVAAEIASAPAARWWDAPAARDEQWRVDFGYGADGAAAAPERRRPARAVLTRWQERTLAREAKAGRDAAAGEWSGPWWSIPPTGLTRTTRSIGARGPAGLAWVEDRLGWRRATVSRVPVREELRVYEVDGVEAWSELCRRYPLEVTASRRRTWALATGSASRWVIPDWARVSRDYDAVHLTVLGYMRAATRAIPLAEGIATVIAGWSPDETWWLTDVVADPSSLERWAAVGDGEWVPAQV
ncbi:hypothetical protein [Demequina capsici]|uniref:Uncharacterized protein n=1 Tax=Demequina capsici TaxID=3075620 RepID=A0AA96F839_9MICO|nr:hypothetical protein [Demequina sp. OYTSA14]WNM25344.1 hypothetical protein RN606_04130 [Demequina sp. OYTSA14]